MVATRGEELVFSGLRLIGTGHTGLRIVERLFGGARFDALRKGGLLGTDCFEHYLVYLG